MILRTIARMLIQEHRHRPITGRVLCLGPQLVPMHRGEVDELFAATPHEAARALAEWRAAGADPTPVSDEYFFGRFPIDSLDSLDVVAGFGGTIIHDLNEPVPAELHERFDFIVDGGTFDHLVQIGVGLGSVARMLKPGGRVLHYNAASGYLGACYMTLGPALFYDYYVLNDFADCHVYIVRGTGVHSNDPWDVFHLPYARTRELNSRVNQMSVCIAEKGSGSTSNRLPVQHGYRSPQMRKEFAESERRLGVSPRRPVFVCDRVPTIALREAVKRVRLELRWMRDPRRSWAWRRKKLRNASARLKATGYFYLGRL
ncbi:MAG: hypothetical protein EXQ77_03435 [Thermoleophilia bacterium]|nr:hypothetical protein [Thermoleophilia bacterium]